jgi:hypothetical protein
MLGNIIIHCTQRLFTPKILTHERIGSGFAEKNRELQELLDFRAGHARAVFVDDFPTIFESSFRL